LTLAELSRQLSTVKESLRNVNLQFLEATRTTDVSKVLSAFNFFCQLYDQFLPSPYPPSFEVAVVTADLKMTLTKKHGLSIFHKI
jgi:hypothetical protein